MIVPAATPVGGDGKSVGRWFEVAVATAEGRLDSTPEADRSAVRACCDRHGLPPLPGLGSGYGQKVVTSRAELKTDPVQKGSPLWTAAAIRYPVEIIYLASDHRRIHFWTPCGGGRRRRRWHSQWSRGFEGSLPFGTGLFGAPGPRDHFLHVS